MTATKQTELLPCPFCGSADVEIQGKPAILDALDSVCCNECTADAPIHAWNTRAALAEPAPQQDVAGLVEALRIAANRLDRLTLEVPGGYWREGAAEWTKEARAAYRAAQEKPHD